MNGTKKLLIIIFVVSLVFVFAEIAFFFLNTKFKSNQQTSVTSTNTVGTNNIIPTKSKPPVSSSSAGLKIAKSIDQNYLNTLLSEEIHSGQSIYLVEEYMGHIKNLNQNFKKKNFLTNLSFTLVNDNEKTIDTFILNNPQKAIKMFLLDNKGYKTPVDVSTLRNGSYIQFTKKISLSTTTKPEDRIVDYEITLIK